MLRLVYDVAAIMGAARFLRRAQRHGASLSWRQMALMAGVTALCIGGFVAATAIAATRPGLLTGGLGLVVVLGLVLVTAATLIVLLMHIGETPEERIAPPSLAIAYSASQDRLRPWLTGWAASFAATCAGLVLVPEDWSWLPITGGIVLLLAGVSFLMPLQIIARRRDRSVTALMAAPWVRWRFDPAIWQSWAASHRDLDGRTAQGDLRKIGPVFAILIVAGLLVAILTGYRPDAADLLFGCPIVLTIGGVAAWLRWIGPARHYRRLAGGPPEAWFGPPGFLAGNLFMPWARSGSYLIGAAIHDGPRGAELEMGFMVFNGSQEYRIEHTIPLPNDATADLAQLQQALRARYPAAAIFLVQTATWN